MPRLLPLCAAALTGILCLVPSKTVHADPDTILNADELIEACDRADTDRASEICLQLADRIDFEVVGRLPKSARFHLRLSDALRRTGRLDEAHRLLRYAVTYVGPDAQVYLELGLLLSRSFNSCVEAIGPLAESIRHGPSSEAYAVLAECEYELEYYEEALEHYEAVDEPLSLTPNVLLGKAAALVALGRAPDAIRLLTAPAAERRLQDPFDRAEAALIHGRALVELGEYAAAAEIFKRLIEAGSYQVAMAQCGLARALAGLERAAEAHTACAKARRQFGEDVCKRERGWYRHRDVSVICGP